MNANALFACSKCFSRHPFEELSTGQQLCKNCRVSSTQSKCNICRSEYFPSSAIRTAGACKKCDYNIIKYGKPKPCECCKIVAAFGNTKCMRCASYEVKYGPPVQCDECKQRSAFDKRDENKKFNGKLLCWLCSCALKRAVLKANDEMRQSKGKRPHEPSSSSGHTSAGMTDLISDAAAMPPHKKSARSYTEVLSKYRGSATSNGTRDSSASTAGISSMAAETLPKASRTKGLEKVAALDPHSSDHVVAMNNLRERISSLEKRLQQKDKDLLEKDKLLTELKGKNFEKEIDMRNKMKEVDRLHEMKVENLNRKVSSLLKEIAGLKKGNKKQPKVRDYSPKDLLTADDQLSHDRDYEDKKEERSSSSRSTTPYGN